jgi:O-antigen/teichoic acid export membrane protein/peptidoglycan/xylan/chitin deacetylase (PgdA/CDA1 family)
MRRVLDALVSSGLGWMASSVGRAHGCLVLTYHRVGTSESGFKTVPADAFRSHMRWLRDRCTIIHPDQLIDSARTSDRRKPSVLVTFDDGYCDFHDVAYPIMRELAIPSVNFISTHYTDTGDLFWWDIIDLAVSASTRPQLTLPWDSAVSIPLTAEGRRRARLDARRWIKSRPHSELETTMQSLMDALGVRRSDLVCGRQVMTWDQIRATQEFTVFGAHTHTHPLLTRVGTDQLDYEVRTSRDRLRAELGQTPTMFAYPSGAYSDEAKEIVRRHGFVVAFAANSGVNNGQTDWMATRRVYAPPQSRRLAMSLLNARNVTKAPANPDTGGVRAPQTTEPQASITQSHADRRAASDVTGRTHLTRNVLASWSAQIVQIIGGFMLPRLIDQNLGQTLLGIWDFSWSLVAYLTTAQLGVGSSIDRYVSRHRAAGDYRSLNQVVSSVMGVQLVAASMAALFAVGLAFAIPTLFAARLGTAASTAQWVVLFLGLSVAIDMAFDVFRGVVTGCHRWDLFNLVDTSSYITTLLAMFLVLQLGGGLTHIALAYFVGAGIMQLTRCWAAYRVCPELQLRRAYASWTIAKEMLVFGLKGAMYVISRLILFQANALVVAWTIGPAALAVFARPVALTRNVESFVNKLSWVISPTASSMQQLGQQAQLRGLLIQSTRYAVALALPALLFLAILGGQLLELWMGPAYARGDLIAIIAGGFFLLLSQSPAAALLKGLNKHGFAGVASLISALLGVVMSVVLVGVLKTGLVGAAATIAVTLTLGNGLIIPMHACKAIGLSLGAYVSRAFILPILCCLPFAGALVFIRFFAATPLVALLLGGVAAGVLLLPLYWAFLAPASIKTPVRKRLGVAFGGFATSR